MEQWLQQAPPYVPWVGGCVLLLFGRRILWLSLGLVGFALGWALAPLLPLTLGASGPAWLEWAIPLGLGLVGAILAGAVRDLAVRCLGAASGAYLGLVALSPLAAEFGAPLAWTGVVVAGVLGAIVSTWVVDRSVEVLTALVGAHLLLTQFGFVSTALWAGTLALALAGFVFQWRQAAD